MPARARRRKARLRKAPATGALPTYDSMQQCAAQTGIPLRLLKQAKRDGSSAFHSNRVRLRELLPFLFKGTVATAAPDFRGRLEAAKAQREEIRLAKETGQVLDRDTVRTGIQRAMLAVFSVLDRPTPTKPFP